MSILVDSITDEEIERIAKAVAEKLLPILLAEMKNTGLRGDVVHVVEDERKQQIKDSISSTGFREDLYA
jgi:hypothetical protein